MTIQSQQGLHWEQEPSSKNLLAESQVVHVMVKPTEMWLNPWTSLHRHKQKVWNKMLKSCPQLLPRHKRESNSEWIWWLSRRCLTCHTPTMALAIRMSKITKGSTKAVMVSSPSSNQARTWKQHKKRVVSYLGAWINKSLSKGRFNRLDFFLNELSFCGGSVSGQ